MNNFNEKIINRDPIIKIIDPIFSNDFCSEVINAANNHFQISNVDDGKLPGIRKSSSFDITSNIKNKTINLFNKNYLNAFASNFEHDDIQITRYEEGEYYLPHFDAYNFFLNKKIKEKKYQRIKTIILYLNDDYDGGQIYFSNLNLKIKPSRGNFLVFENCIGESHYIHPNALHESKIVTRGVKYIATLWLKEPI